MTVKIHGLPISSNVVGPLMLAREAGVGELVPCNLRAGAHKSEDYLNNVHAYGQIPGMTDDDGKVKMGESTAILRREAAAAWDLLAKSLRGVGYRSPRQHGMLHRYLALKYRKSAYPVDDEALCGTIDFACDSFACVYKAHAQIVVPILGFTPMPADDAETRAGLAKAYVDAMDKWCAVFLKKKFVGGDEPSIADFKAASFLVCAEHPSVKKNFPTYEVHRPRRMRRTNCTRHTALVVSGNLASGRCPRASRPSWPTSPPPSERVAH